MQSRTFLSKSERIAPIIKYKKTGLLFYNVQVHLVILNANQCLFARRKFGCFKRERQTNVASDMEVKQVLDNKTLVED